MTASSGRYHLTLAHQLPHEAAASAGERPATEGAALRPGLEANEASQPLLRVGDLAKITGKTVRAIHHYEELGLIEPVGRSKGHYRLFDAETPVRIRWISKLQSLGLSLGEIRTMVRTRQATPSAMQAAGQLRSMYEEKLVEVRSRLAELTALERELQASLAYLDACGSSCTPELGPTDCAQCHRHPEDRHADEHHSDLISGALV
ncbi:MAG TPA: MerR family transcriptional regulator [Polyangiaceae bacterium]|nr:MerR family transcriptional regulator [Polyangiaceae bacterium]